MRRRDELSRAGMKVQESQRKRGRGKGELTLSFLPSLPLGSSPCPSRNAPERWHIKLSTHIFPTPLYIFAPSSFGTLSSCLCVSSRTLLSRSFPAS